MGVPGNPPPPGLAETELFAVDAYRTEFDATVTEVDREGGRVALARTAFYPVGGGQPSDTGTIQTPAGTLTVTGVRRERGTIWHTVEGELPDVGAEVQGEIDWDRRHRLMRTHTALHMLCGVIWADYSIPVTGGNMEPMKGRLDFPFPAMSADLGATGRAPDQRGDRAGARDRRRLPAAQRRRHRPGPDPHVREPDPAARSTRCGSSTSSVSTGRPTAAPTCSRPPRWAACASWAPRARARTTSASASRSCDRRRRETGMTKDHLVGLLLGAEEDWPRAFEEILRRVGPRRRSTGRDPHGLERADDHRAVRPRDPVRTRSSSTGWRGGTTTRASG